VPSQNFSDTVSEKFEGDTALEEKYLAKPGDPNDEPNVDIKGSLSELTHEKIMEELTELLFDSAKTSSDFGKLFEVFGAIIDDLDLE